MTSAGVGDGEGDGHTIQPTVLVHDAYIKLRGSDVDWADRANYRAKLATHYKNSAASLAEASPSLKTVGADHQANAEIARARLASTRRQFAQASRIFEEVLAGQENTYGKVHAALLPILIEMTAHYRRAGDNARAVAIGERAVALGQAALPEDNWLTGVAAAQYALALEQAGRREMAAEMAGRARSILVPLFGASDRRLARLQSL